MTISDMKTFVEMVDDAEDELRSATLRVERTKKELVEYLGKEKCFDLLLPNMSLIRRAIR
jgi:capsule polysaccharide export protein KpsE/RkpR